MRKISEKHLFPDSLREEYLVNADLNRSAFVISAGLMGNPPGLTDGTSFLITVEYCKSTINFVRTEGSLISTIGAPIAERLISKQRERLSFSGKARKIRISTCKVSSILAFKPYFRGYAQRTTKPNELMTSSFG